DEEALRLAYKAGCRGMLVGLESFDEQNLLDYQKKLNVRSLDRYQQLIDTFHRCGIAVFGAVIVGADNDRVGSVKQAMETAIRLGVDILQMTTLTPLPGTQLFEEFQAAGRIIADNYPKDWEKYTFINTVIKPKHMTAQELDDEVFLLRRGAVEQRWVLRRTLKTLLRTRSLSTAWFVHGMNNGFRRMARSLVQWDGSQFKHLANCPAMKIPH
ncbi:unnamed protein product, partial [marine sediment metagenome]